MQNSLDIHELRIPKPPIPVHAVLLTPQNGNRGSDATIVDEDNSQLQFVDERARRRSRSVGPRTRAQATPPRCR